MATVPGIYVIRNTVNGKLYVGQSEDISERWRDHRKRLRGNYHPNPKLQYGWNKYGEAIFEFQIIEVVPDLTQLDAREEWHGLDLRPFYNIKPFGRSWRLMRGIAYSDAAIARVKQAFEALLSDGEVPTISRISKRARLSPQATLAILHFDTYWTPERISAARQEGQRRSLETLRRRGWVNLDKARAQARANGHLGGWSPAHEHLRAQGFPNLRVGWEWHKARGYQVGIAALRHSQELAQRAYMRWLHRKREALVTTFHAVVESGAAPTISEVARVAGTSRQFVRQTLRASGLYTDDMALAARELQRAQVFASHKDAMLDALRRGRETMAAAGYPNLAKAREVSEARGWPGARRGRETMAALGFPNLKKALEVQQADGWRALREANAKRRGVPLAPAHAEAVRRATVARNHAQWLATHERVLAALAEYPVRPRINALAARLRVDRHTVRAHLRALEGDNPRGVRPLPVQQPLW